MRNRKLFQNLCAQGRVVHLGVELEAEQVPPVADGGHGRVLGEGEAGESRWQSLDAVAVAHPHLEGGRQIVEQGRATSREAPAGGGAVLVQGGVAELLLGAPGHRASQLVDQRLHAVADAQHRQLPFEDPVWDHRRAILVDTGRTAREDDALGVDPLNLLPRVRGVGNLGVDLQLADAAGNEMAVLRAEVDDGYALCLPVCWSQGIRRRCLERSPGRRTPRGHRWQQPCGPAAAWM